MAVFQRGNNGGESSGNGRKTASAFINFYVERDDGSKAKLCAAPLYMDREDHEGLIQAINSGELTVEDVRDALILDFQMAGKAKAGFAIKKASASEEESASK